MKISDKALVLSEHPGAVCKKDEDGGWRAYWVIYDAHGNVLRWATKAVDAWRYLANDLKEATRKYHHPRRPGFSGLRSIVLQVGERAVLDDQYSELHADLLRVLYKHGVHTYKESRDEAPT